MGLFRPPIVSENEAVPEQENPPFHAPCSPYRVSTPVSEPADSSFLLLGSFLNTTSLLSPLHVRKPCW